MQQFRNAFAYAARHERAAQQFCSAFAQVHRSNFELRSNALLQFRNAFAHAAAHAFAHAANAPRN
eukprot:4028413-Lingulodinium_polyedra.AAC.1